MERKTVVKFGGSNLQKPEDFQKLVKVVRNYNKPIVIVVSAFCGVTDKLTKIIAYDVNSTQNIKLICNDLASIHKQIIFHNISNSEASKNTFSEVDSLITELESILNIFCKYGRSNIELKDLILTFGERFTATILNAILINSKIDSELIFPENLGLITDGRFGNSRINFNLSEEKVTKKLSSEKTFVIPGFYGISEKNQVTTFGRGGSDYTAASIAKIINASSLDFWKDVDGLQSADPRIVTNTFQIKRLNYDEASELAYFGAKILHPLSIEPIAEKNIPVKIFNINKVHENNLPETIINKDNCLTKTIKSITYSNDFGIIKLEGSEIGYKAGILSLITRCLNNAEINIKSVITSQTTINLLLSKNDLKNAGLILQNNQIETVSSIKIIDDISTIAVVGNGLYQHYENASRIFSAITKSKINIRLISYGASESSAYFIINKQDKDHAVQAIHAEIFESKKAEFHNINSL